MSKKILLIGPNFHDFNQYVADAFCQLEWAVTILAYDTPIHPYSQFNKIRYKLYRHKELLQVGSRESFSIQAQVIFDKVSPQIVFLLNGEMLTTEVMHYFSKSSKVVVWFYDSITRLPYCWNIVPLCHSVFCYEKDDIRLIKERLNIDAGFLPQAVDSSVYCKIPQMKKEWDIVFAADMWKSPKRMRLIQSVVAHFPDKKIRVWGIYKPWYKGLWNSVTREHRDIYTNSNASSHQLNLDYNKARVVLNIHNEQQTIGANPKLYEISASGSYQICDTNPYIESIFRDGEIGLYDNEESLLELIKWALDPTNEVSRETSAQRAREIVLAEHTYVQRVQHLLGSV